MPVSGAYVLVVDDDKNLLDLLVDTLTTIGYRTAGAAGGAEALEQLARERFDLVITDIKMPLMDGFALLREIRRLHPKTPVLFITGVATDDIMGKAAPDGFLAKPFRISHIEELIENTLHNKAETASGPIRHVLVVDDDDIFRDMLSEALHLSGYVAYPVATGELALKELRNKQIDAVITDIRMPGMDGITLLHRIKKDYPDLPVILITAFLHASDGHSGNSLGTADGLLEKPFKVEAVIELLRELSRAATVESSD